MKVGDLVRIKHAPDTIGLVTQIKPNPNNSVTFRVVACWLHLGMKNQDRYSFELEVINESR